MKNITTKFAILMLLLIFFLNSGCRGWTFFSYRTTYYFSFDVVDENPTSKELNAKQGTILNILKKICEDNNYKFQGVRQEAFLKKLPIHVPQELLQQEPLFDIYRFYNPSLNIPCYYIPKKNKLVIKEELPESDRKERFRHFLSLLRSSLAAQKIRYTLETCKFRMSSLKGSTQFEELDFFYEGTDAAIEYRIEKSFE